MFYSTSDLKGNYGPELLTACGTNSSFGVKNACLYLLDTQ